MPLHTVLEADMRVLLLASLILHSLARPVPGQSGPEWRPSGNRTYTATAGVGNSLGWFGVQGERYVLDERLSIFAGLGYAPGLGGGSYRPTFAAGVRSFTSGYKHRLFLEASASRLVTTSASPTGGRYYGPGMQAGYQFVSPGGFTLMASLGAGYALGVPRGNDPWANQVGLSLGYTWRRLPDLGGRRQM